MRSEPDRSSLPVLHLDGTTAEWYTPSPKPKLGRVEVGGVGPGDLASAAALARKAAGSSKRSCILALGGDLLRLRVVELPRLSGQEIQPVLLRKAAALLGVEAEDTYYYAREITPPEKAANKNAKETSSWLIVAMKRDETLALRKALRSAGIHVRRVVSARWAPIAEVAANPNAATECPLEKPESFEDKDGDGVIDQGSVVVGVESAAVTVTLLSATSVHSHSVLQGDLAGDPAMAITLMQELRGLDAFWRKESRGRDVRQVVVAGLEPDRADLLCKAVQNALPQATATALAGGSRPVLTVADTEIEENENEESSDAKESKDAGQGEERAAASTALLGRIEILESCRLKSDLVPNLSIPLPSRKLSTVALLCAMSLVAIGLAGVTWRDLSSDLQTLEGQVVRMQAESKDLDQIESERGAALRAESELTEAAKSLARVRTDGFSAKSVLGDVFRAFGSRSALMTLTVSPDGRVWKVSATGVTEPHPVLALRTIDALGRDLEASASLEDVDVEPPTRLPENERRAGRIRPFDFSLRAKLEKESK